MASPNPREDAPVTPGPPRLTSTTSPVQTVDRSMSSTVTPGTPTESDFCVPDNTEEFWAKDLHQAQEKIAQIQATVDANVRISTHNLLISDLHQEDIQQLLEKKHSGSRATFTDDQVLFEIMPGNAHEQLIVFLHPNFVKAMEAANCPMTRSTWVAIGATSSKGQFCGKEPDWGVRPIAPGASGATNPPPAEERWPSLVVEVGTSQSHASLQRDARWWWNNSGGATKLILLFKIEDTPGFAVEVELWEEVVAYDTGVATRSSRPPSISTNLQRTQSTTVDASGQHSGISLRYSTLMRQAPGPTHPELVVLTPEMLSDICAPAV
ncbi:hypothetical protein N7489_008510 [Penicillium chrysogenum]|uniref:uncharacterized protein n=1 Tax=Penicillium chrysogenum TaxID=5076 RepID=UPI002397A099|nr:uncharacterized protein N7489_008510 [Penicillium chrysogenum]KAJ5227802.1 hypothetical protein N7489_008510 [Penicillium chrysogenum]KAJ5286472.1 hypothetical protein N7524_001778 [Penicillium chrysogenum]